MVYITKNLVLQFIKLYYECKNHFYYKGKKFMGFKAFNLHPTLMKAIDDIAPKGAAAGMRYPEEGMKTVNR